MAELTGEELREGNMQLGGIRILYWIETVLIGIGIIYNAVYIYFIPLYLRFFYVMSRQSGINIERIIPLKMLTLYTRIYVIVYLVLSLIFLAMLIIGLLGIKRRRSYSVPLGRAILVITMLNVPVGTIIGAILWGRLRHPAAKKYLNYGV